MSLSEGGLAIVAGLDLEQGDPIQLTIEPGGKLRPIKVSAIVWNDAAASPTGRSSQIRKVGCVVSQPSRAYLSLIESLDAESKPSRPAAIPIARPKKLDLMAHEPDLPRSKELQPPPKTEPEDSLPYFRVRMKQIGGPRTRILTLRARSATQAERLALQELDQICPESAGWGVLHIARVR